MLAVFSSPSRYTQGKDATESLGSEMRNLGLGGAALILAGNSAARLLAKTWRRTFAKADMKFEVHPFGVIAHDPAEVYGRIGAPAAPDPAAFRPAGGSSPGPRCYDAHNLLPGADFFAI